MTPAFYEYDGVFEPSDRNSPRCFKMWRVQLWLSGFPQIAFPAPRLFGHPADFLYTAPSSEPVLMNVRDLGDRACGCRGSTLGLLAGHMVVNCRAQLVPAPLENFQMLGGK